jgi:hypothetical protein
VHQWFCACVKVRERPLRVQNREERADYVKFVLDEIQAKEGSKRLRSLKHATARNFTQPILSLWRQTFPSCLSNYKQVCEYSSHQQIPFRMNLMKSTESSSYFVVVCPHNITIFRQVDK